MTTRTVQPIRIAIACGGTGGHLFPGVAIGRALVERGCGVTLLVSPKEVDQEAVRTALDLTVATLPAVGLQSGRKGAFVAGFVKSLAQSLAIFRRSRPAAVLAMGGFTSAPPVLAGKLFRARTCLHESNTIPGRANRLLARLVDRAFIGFPGTAELLRGAITTCTGTPARSEFVPGDAAAARKELGLDPDRAVALVMGGSQGASGLNDLVLRSIPLVQADHPELQWIHFTGSADLDRAREAYVAMGIKAFVRAFFPSMHIAMTAATVAVSRSGASSLAEIAALRLPSILVPYPAAMDDHQFHNAHAFARTGAALLLEQKSTRPADLASFVKGLLDDEQRRRVLAEALDRWHAPNAARDIAEAILACVRNEAGVRVHQTGSGACSGTRLEQGRVA